MESNFKKLFSSVNGGRAVNSTNKLGQNRRQFTRTKSMPPDTVQLSQAQGGLGENVRLTKKKFGLSRNYKNRNAIAAFDGSKVISADTIGNLTQKEFKKNDKFTRKFILQFLYTKLDKCQNDDSKLTNLILSIKNTVTTEGKLAATTNDDIKLALTFLNKILEGAEKHNETISEKMMETLNAFSEVDEISEETKNEINKQKQAVISKQIELALNTRDEDVIENTINQLGNMAQNNPNTDLAIKGLGNIAQNTNNKTVINWAINKLGVLAQNPKTREQAIQKLIRISCQAKNKDIKNIAITQFRVIAQNSKVDSTTRNLAINGLGVSALDPENTEQAIQELGVLAQKPLTTKQAIQELGDLALDSDTRKLAIQELGVLAQNPETSYLAINKLGDIAQTSGDKKVINNVMTQLVNIARNPEAREQVINKLGDIAQKTNVDNVHSYAFFTLCMIARNPKAREQVINKLVVLAQNPDTSDLAINKLVDIAQNTKDETVLSNAINGLGDIAQNTETRELVMDEFRVLAQNPKTGSLAINQLGVLARNANPAISSSAISQLAFIVLNPGIDEKTKEKAINKLGDIAQDPKVDQKTKEKAIRQLGVCARNDKTSEQVISKQVINKLGAIAQNSKVDYKTKEKAIDKLGDIAQDKTVDQKTRDLAITQLGAIAKSNDEDFILEAINKLRDLSQKVFITNDTKVKIVSTLKDVATKYPYTVRDILNYMKEFIIFDNDKNVLENINLAIKEIDEKYPNAGEIESNNIEENTKKKAYFEQNS